MRKKFIPWNKGKTKYKSKLCLCGCGQYTKVGKWKRKDGLGYTYWENSWIKGHEKRGINGFNKPGPEPKLCACGCGQYANVLKWKRESGSYKYYVATWVKGHQVRGMGGYNPEIHEPRNCACGCGQITKKRRGKYNKFISGHQVKGHIPWNKGKRFPESVRIKMSLAKRGIPPANKADVDINKVYRLYVDERKTSGEIAKILGYSIDVIKNRIRGQKWVRTTKESCSLESFKEKMRAIRIKRLVRFQRGDQTNLETILYKILNECEINFIPQYPMYNKFVVDAYLPEFNLIIEAFGKYWHNLPQIKKKDQSKRKYLKKCGHRILELWQEEIQDNPEYCINKIVNEILKNHQQTWQESSV